MRVVGTAEATRMRASELFGFRMRWLLLAASAVLVLAFPPRDPWPMAVVGLLLVYNLAGWWIVPRLTTAARGRASGLASLALLNVFAAAVSFSYGYIPESPGWLVFYFLPMSAALRFGVRASVPQALLALVIDAGARYYALSRYGVEVDVAAVVLRGCVYTGIAVFAGVWAETVVRQRRELDRAAAESAELHAAAEARADRLHALTDIQRQITERLEPREVCEHVAQAAAQLLGAKLARVWIGDAASGELRAIAADGDDGAAAERLDDGSARAAAASGRVLTDGPPDRSCYAVYAPMRFEGKVVGVLAVAGLTERPDPEQLELLQALSASGAIAVENARLFGVWGETQALHRLDELKSEFIGTISHELRTPLTVILGLAEVLTTMPKAPPTVKVAAGEMLRSSEVMARLVDDLLTFAQFEKGQLVVRREPIELGQFLERVVAGAVHGPGGERLRLHPGAPGLTVTADPVRLRQVVANLLSNALRYAPSGSIAVRYAADGDVARVEVVDEGPGISADEQSRVWERFYRGRSVAGVAGERATGIGLAVVKALVEAQGGTVGLTSSPGGGSTFSFCLPLAAAVHRPASTSTMAVL